MSKEENEDTPGIYIDEETNQIVFDYDELDEASQKTLDGIFAYLQENDENDQSE